MAAEWSSETTELFGGAMTCDFPKDWIDASNLREIPSHEEVYLSPTTDTNLVVEINQFVTPEEINPTLSFSASPPTTPPHQSQRSSDLETQEALIYHLRDLIDPADRLTSISSPKRVHFTDPSLTPYNPSYLTHGKVEVRRSLHPPQPTSSSSAITIAPPITSPDDLEITSTTIHLLLIRIPEKETDLCVQVNVPYKVLNGGIEVAREEAIAERILETVLRSLRVKDFELFDG